MYLFLFVCLSICLFVCFFLFFCYYICLFFYLFVCLLVCFLFECVSVFFLNVCLFSNLSIILRSYGHFILVYEDWWTLDIIKHPFPVHPVVLHPVLNNIWYIKRKTKFNIKIPPFNWYKSYCSDAGRFSLFLNSKAVSIIHRVDVCLSVRRLH